MNEKLTNWIEEINKDTGIDLKDQRKSLKAEAQKAETFEKYMEILNKANFGVTPALNDVKNYVGETKVKTLKTNLNTLIYQSKIYIKAIDDNNADIAKSAKSGIFEALKAVKEFLHIDDKCKSSDVEYIANSIRKLSITNKGNLKGGYCYKSMTPSAALALVCRVVSANRGIITITVDTNQLAEFAEKVAAKKAEKETQPA